jgi:hypothetical protein
MERLQDRQELEEVDEVGLGAGVVENGDAFGWRAYSKTTQVRGRRGGREIDGQDGWGRKPGEVGKLKVNSSIASAWAVRGRMRAEARSGNAKRALHMEGFPSRMG